MSKINGFDIQQTFWVDEQTLEMLIELKLDTGESKSAYLRSLIRKAHKKYKGERVRRSSDKVV